MFDKCKSFTQNYFFCRLKLVVERFEHSNKPNNQNSIKGLKVVKPTNKKRYCKTLETSLINSPMFPPSLHKNAIIENVLIINRSLKIVCQSTKLWFTNKYN